MNTYSYGRYKLTFTYKGDEGSPFLASNTNNYVVKVEDTKSKKFCHVNYWGKSKEMSEKIGAEAFIMLMQTALIGAQEPMVFCEMMHLNPEFEESSRPKFEACRDVTEKLVHVVNEDYRDVMGRLARKNGLQLARRKVK